MKIKYKIYLYFILSLSAFSCNDYLDVTSQSQVSDATLWNRAETADLFLNNIYNTIPSPFNMQDPPENWSDNAMNGVVSVSSRTIVANAIYEPSNTPNQWNHYANIRKANLFIEKITESNLPEEWKKQRIGEAKFLRAYYYMLLWTHHGGIPIITDVLNISEQGDAVFRPRNTAEETFLFLNKECTEAAEMLPVTSNKGRATKGAALALKGWCELFWASPFYNPNNELERWENAALTNKQIMDLGVYSLFSDYNQLFFEENDNNAEVIFDRQHLGGTVLGHARERYQGPWNVGGAFRSNGGVNPSQELVDEYLMANGLPITDPKSDYDAQNPYKNREQRFYQSIVFDGSEWAGYEMVMKQGVGSPNATDLSDVNEATNTGYYLKKGLNPTYAVLGNTNQNGSNFIIFRYAEILLSYAEARNEYLGPDQSVYDAVNKVRLRSSLPEVQAGLDQKAMRQVIHRERRVELAFEEKRWYDLIRLKLAEEKLNGSLHAMVIEKSGNQWVYRIVPAPSGKRTFYPEKNYLFPIPQWALDRNTNLSQNVGY